MALLWCDGFDHYGGNTANLNNGTWADASSVFFNTSSKRTGTYCVTMQSTLSRLRRVLGGPKTRCGVGYALLLPALPTSGTGIMFSFRNADNQVNLSLRMTTTGILSVFGPSGEIANSGVPVFVAGTYQYIEMQGTFNSSTGAFEVRLNGVTVVSASNVNTVIDPAKQESSQVQWEQVTTVSAEFFDDFYAYDDTGSFNNTFLGDRRIYTLYPNADTAQADWTPLSGTGWENIDEGADGDASYIQAPEPGSPSEIVSEFELQNLPVTTGFIAAVVVSNFVRKTEAGIADFQSGIISNGVDLEKNVRPVNTTYTYFEDVYEYDPDTGASFTLPAVDALQVRVKRVS